MLFKSIKANSMAFFPEKIEHSYLVQIISQVLKKLNWFHDIRIETFLPFRFHCNFTVLMEDIQTINRDLDREEENVISLSNGALSYLLAHVVGEQYCTAYVSLSNLHLFLIDFCRTSKRSDVFVFSLNTCEIHSHGVIRDDFQKVRFFRLFFFVYFFVRMNIHNFSWKTTSIYSFAQIDRRISTRKNTCSFLYLSVQKLTAHWLLIHIAQLSS